MTKRELAKRLDAAQQLWNTASAAIQTLNEAVEQIAADLRNGIDEKSDSWQESEAGSELVAVCDELESFHVDEPEDLPVV